MPKQIKWPSEGIALEICWNGDPDNIEEIPREFVPDGCCENCWHHKNDGCLSADGDLDDVCTRYEWDQETLLDEPREPRREDYRTEKAYRQAKQCVHDWYCRNTNRFGDRE